MRINYKNLPQIFQNGLVTFSSDEEKRIFLASVITVTSGLFPTVTGIYDGQRVCSNLYTFITAPAASGKSAMKYGKQFAEEIHKQVKSEITLGGASSSKLKAHNLLFIPANTSAAAFIKTVGANNKGVIAAESEADTLSQVLTKDYGGFSDGLRKAYHHETISYLRATDNEYIEVESPKLSLLLTGTPMQVTTLLPNVEDGLFSRFSFVAIDQVSKWKSPFASKADKSKIIAPLSKKMQEIYNLALEGNFEFKLSEEQELKLDTMGEEWLEKAKKYGANSESIAYRSGLILFRTAIVLAAIKHFEDGKTDVEITCSDKLFECACNYCESNFYDSLQVYTVCGKTASVSRLSPKEAQLFDNLPKDYEMPSDVNKEAANIGISERSAYNFQQKFVKLKLVEINKGKIWSKVA